MLGLTGRPAVRREQLPLSLGPEIYLRFQLGTDERIFNPALPRDVWIRAISNMQNAYTGAPKHTASLWMLHVILPGLQHNAAEQALLRGLQCVLTHTRVLRVHGHSLHRLHQQTRGA